MRSLCQAQLPTRAWLTPGLTDSHEPNSLQKNQDALDYHSSPPAGKIEVRPTKPFLTQGDLSLAYTPGVAEPCREIADDPLKVFDYTAKGNLVAVVTNGTAVLGLGNIGPLAGKPVMEGKAGLFKRFAGVDVFDIELDSPDVDGFCQTVKAMAPTFGGINIEDVKAPDCFLIEERLRKELDIPVFHDDQHGTAIIIAAGLVNAMQLAGKTFAQAKVVFSGAGAAALATASLVQRLGVKLENILLCDSKGVVHKDRPQTRPNPYKAAYARDTERRTLEDALQGADVFIGVSVGGLLKPEMLMGMADKPIIFALANPDPEIPYPEARKARPDAIVATGRSDYPNQVNNVLGFPFIFRGALDARASTVNTEMMLAAVHALAELAHEDYEDSVAQAYGGERLEFGPEYIIPKPFDSRALLRVAPAVALAAGSSGVARRPIKDAEAYRAKLEKILGKDRELMRFVIDRARRQPRRVVLADGEHERALRAAAQAVEEKILLPILIGRQEVVARRAKELSLDLTGCEVIDPDNSELAEPFAQTLFELRGRKGMTLTEARRRMRTRDWFSAMLLRQGHAHGMVSGLGGAFPESFRPVLKTVGLAPHAGRVAGVHLMVMQNEIFFFADTSLNVDPTAEEMAHTACLTADFAKGFDQHPRIAMLSFSNFGSVPHERSAKVRRATELVRSWRPDLEVEGEMHADTALMPDVAAAHFPFSQLRGRANVLIFPSLESGNIAQKIAQYAGAEGNIGPILMGLNHPAYIVPQYCSVRELLLAASITAMMTPYDNGEGVSA